MALKDDLETQVQTIFKEEWKTRDGTVVPNPEDLKLYNDAVKLTGTVLYADLAESTNLVKKMKAHFAAEVYKSYLHCASKIINNYNGTVTAFDGDRVMAVFIGEKKNSRAVRTALAINYAVRHIINPKLKEQYPNADFILSHGVGIDTSALFIARTGVRGSNDLVWVGNSANYAAKLSALRDGDYPLWITKSIRDNIDDNVVKSAKNDVMWEERTWKAQGITIYRSNYWWAP